MTELMLEVEKTKATGQVASTIESKKIKNNTKAITMLSLFVDLGEKGLNCFEAVRHHDYVLRSTISDFQLNYGLSFSRKWETVPNAFGKKTECVRYWLDKNSIERALRLIGRDKVSEVIQGD